MEPPGPLTRTLGLVVIETDLETHRRRLCLDPSATEQPTSADIVIPDDIQDVYRRVLSEAAIPFAPITELEDWHLRIFFLPSFMPETVYDLDHREGKTRFHRSRFQRSVWLALSEASRTKGVVQSFTSERACIELPGSHPLVKLVSDEHVFRMGDRDIVTLDGDLYAVQLTHASGTLEFEADANTMDERWMRILGALHEAGKLLPER